MDRLIQKVFISALRNVQCMWIKVFLDDGEGVIINPHQIAFFVS